MREEVVAKDKWGQIIFYDEWNSLELKWFPSTANATDADVKTTMELFAEETVNRRPHTLIVDTTDFHHAWGEGVMEWRSREIIPRYNQGGVTKLAFIAAPNYPWQTVEQEPSLRRRVQQTSRPGGSRAAKPLTNGWQVTRPRAPRKPDG